jgi:hypothetical protein
VIGNAASAPRRRGCLSLQVVEAARERTVITRGSSLELMFRADALFVDQIFDGTLEWT